MSSQQKIIFSFGRYALAYRDTDGAALDNHSEVPIAFVLLRKIIGFWVFITVVNLIAKGLFSSNVPMWAFVVFLLVVIGLVIFVGGFFGSLLVIIDTTKSNQSTHSSNTINELHWAFLLALAVLCLIQGYLYYIAKMPHSSVFFTAVNAVILLLALPYYAYVLRQKFFR